MQILSQSSDIVRRPQKFALSSTYNLMLLSNVKQKVEDEPNFYGLLRISKLYYVSDRPSSERNSFAHRFFLKRIKLLFLYPQSIMLYLSL